MEECMRANEREREKERVERIKQNKKTNKTGENTHNLNELSADNSNSDESVVVVETNKRENNSNSKLLHARIKFVGW